eukprot:1042449-Rhodomonas_salina.1
MRNDRFVYDPAAPYPSHARNALITEQNQAISERNPAISSGKSAVLGRAEQKSVVSERNSVVSTAAERKSVGSAIVGEQKAVISTVGVTVNASYES